METQRLFNVTRIKERRSHAIVRFMFAAVERSHKLDSFQTAAFACMTFTVLATEIVFSRLFAGTMTYYCAFMLVSLAMLGLGSGSLIVQLAPQIFREETFGTQTFVLSSACGIALFGGTLG